MSSREVVAMEFGLYGTRRDKQLTFVVRSETGFVHSFRDVELTGVVGDSDQYITQTENIIIIYTVSQNTAPLFIF